MDLREVPHEEQEQAITNTTVKCARNQKEALHDALAEVGRSLASAFAVRWFDCERVSSASSLDRWLGFCLDPAVQSWALTHRSRQVAYDAQDAPTRRYLSP